MIRGHRFTAQVLASLLFWLAGVGLAWAADLTIAVQGAGPVGDIRIRLYNKESGFPADGRAFAAFILTAADGQASVTLHQVPPGRYAAAAFQDVDGSQTLTTNWLGIPTEPYGFSHAASAGVFSQAAIEVGDSSVIVEIKLQ